MKASSAVQQNFQRSSGAVRRVERVRFGAWLGALVDAIFRAGDLALTPISSRHDEPASRFPDAISSASPGDARKIIELGISETLAMRASDEVYETDRLWWEEVTRAERMR